MTRKRLLQVRRLAQGHHSKQEVGDALRELVLEYDELASRLARMAEARNFWRHRVQGNLAARIATGENPIVLEVNPNDD